MHIYVQYRTCKGYAVRVRLRVQVQVRAWRLGDADWALEPNAPLDPRRTVFLGGVPRPLRARTPTHLTHTA